MDFEATEHFANHIYQTKYQHFNKETLDKTN